MLDGNFYKKNNDLIWKCINELTYLFNNILSSLFSDINEFSCAVDTYTIEDSPWISTLDILYIVNFEIFPNLTVSVLCITNQEEYITTISIFTNGELFERMEFGTKDLSISELVAGMDSIKKMIKSATLHVSLNDTILC